jgi:hypothetical protein
MSQEPDGDQQWMSPSFAWVLVILGVIWWPFKQIKRLFS